MPLKSDISNMNSFMFYRVFTFYIDASFIIIKHIPYVSNNCQSNLSQCLLD